MPASGFFFLAASITGRTVFFSFHWPTWTVRVIRGDTPTRRMSRLLSVVFYVFFVRVRWVRQRVVERSDLLQRLKRLSFGVGGVEQRADRESPWDRPQSIKRCRSVYWEKSYMRPIKRTERERERVDNEALVMRRRGPCRSWLHLPRPCRPCSDFNQQIMSGVPKWNAATALRATSPPDWFALIADHPSCQKDRPIKKKNSVNPVELGRNPGRSIWRAIVRPPRGKKAVRPLRPSAVVDSSGRSERCNKRDKRAPTRFQMARRYDPNTRQQQL